MRDFVSPPFTSCRPQILQRLPEAGGLRSLQNRVSKAGRIIRIMALFTNKNRLVSGIWPGQQWDSGVRAVLGCLLAVVGLNMDAVPSTALVHGRSVCVLDKYTRQCCLQCELQQLQIDGCRQDVRRLPRVVLHKLGCRPQHGVYAAVITCSGAAHEGVVAPRPGPNAFLWVCIGTHPALFPFDVGLVISEELL